MKNKLALLAVSLILPIVSSSCSPKIGQPIQEQSEIMILNDGIDVKKLSTGTNSNGKEYVTLSYEITESGTPHRSVSINCRWKSETNQQEMANVDTYLSSTIDNDEQTFTITKLQDLPAVAVVRLQSTFDESIYADVEIHQRQKFLGFKNVTTIQKVAYESLLKTPITGAYGQNSFYYGWLQRDIESIFSNGFSTVFTDAINQDLKFENLDLEDVEYRYLEYYSSSIAMASVPSSVQDKMDDYITPKLESYLRSSGVLQPDNLRPFTSDTGKQFVLITSPEVYTAFSNGATEARGDGEASFINSLHSYDIGMALDLHYQFDLKLGGQTKTGLDGWISLKIPYSAYEDATEIPLTGITPEDSEYYF